MFKPREFSKEEFVIDMSGFLSNYAIIISWALMNYLILVCNQSLGTQRTMER